MAKLKWQTARKEYTCGKCGCTINKGDNYYKVVAMYQGVRYRCAGCRPTRSELTESEYYKWLYDLQDNVNENYDLRSEEGKDELYSELENQRDELQSRLDNMPEQLQYAPTGETLQERIDSLDDAINELDYLDFPDPDDDDYKLDDEDKQDLEEAEIEEKENALYQEALDDYESNILEIINNIE